MSWSEIKATPSVQLHGLLKALQNNSAYHAFDGYSAEEVGKMAKDKPQIRVNYENSQKVKRKFDAKIKPQQKEITSFRELI